MRLLITALMTLTFLTFTTITTTAKADDVITPPAMKVFPMWEEKQCPKETYACYDFEKTKELINVDLGVQALERRLDNAVLNIADLLHANTRLKEALIIVENDLAEEKGRLAEKQAVLEATTIKLKKADGNSFYTALPWVVTVGVGCVVSAFVGGMYLGSSL